MADDNLTAWLANLSPAKRVLLELRLKEKSLKRSVSSSIPRRLPRGSAPLSFAQERLWFLSQLEPESLAYNEPRALRLTGLLNVEALERSLNAIIQRHEMLRTTFVMVDGMPMQRIAERRDIEVPLIDLQTINENERDTQARRLIEETIFRPFDLSKDCLLRTLLLRLSEQEHIFVLVKHHIGSDGWSSGIFWQEFQSLYTAFTSGPSAELPELPVQYADFATWQRDWLQGEILESQLSYWRKQLNDLSALQLLLDRPRPTKLNPRGATQVFLINNSTATALKILSRESGATLFMTLLAAFQTLLCRYTNQEDIAVGSPIAGRNRIELEGLIGFFANTLVLRADLTNDPSFRALLERVRKACLEAYSHQELPFERLVEELQPERSLSQNPLFQVTFQLNSSPRKAMALPGLRVEPFELSGGMSKFDLSLSMVDNGSSISGRLLYNTDLFDASSIERLVGHFQTLLEGIVAHPDHRISDLLLLTEAERHLLLVEWNDTTRDYPRDKRIHELFEEQVERSPDAVAVVFEDQQLTYRELNNRANQLAHYLRKLGVQPETLVGICVEPSLEMVVGLLGILKAGGAYVPLDPDYPKERFAFILEDTQTKVLLTQKGLIEKLPDHSAHLVCLDRDWGEIEKEAPENDQRIANPENLAYVIYTSGSTGKPKGVTVENRQLVNYSLDIIKRLEPAAGDNFAMVQPLTVDSCITMIFPCLLTGGALHVISREKAISPSELGDYFRRWPIDFLKIAPSHLAALEASSSPEQFMPHRCLVIGGEESRWDWVRSLRALAPGSRVFNHYGPTETTVGVLMYRADGREPSQNHLKTPLGRPVSNVQVFLLDARQQPVPIGIPGELYIGGDNLARGYLNRPELTAEQFIPNPFGGEPGRRLYRTGDRARYLPDGNIEFLGRTDHQLKIRGFRIEAGEIEAVLIQHPGVEQVIVMPWGETPEQQRLVAYVVPSRAQAPSVAELRVFLRNKLPEQMVPSAFILLNELPRTPHGKLDRRALPVPEPSRPELETNYVYPRTPVEEILAGIWAGLLKVEKVGIHDNFFELGGHSLLATQVVSRVREAFQLDLPVRGLFEAPTVAELALRIEPSAPGTSELEELARNLAEVELLSEEEIKCQLVKNT